MQLFQKICFSVCFAFVSSISASPPKVTLETLSQEECLTLPLKGILKEKIHGAIVLEVPAEYLQDLFSRLSQKTPQLTSVPAQERQAQITVINSSERKRANIENIDEVEEEFSFKINEVSVINHPIGTVVLLSIYSPDLEELRNKYGLKKSKLQGDIVIPFAKEQSSSNEVRST